jgi:hypothetical protein
MLGLIGKLTNAALGWAVPGLSASALYIVAGVLAIGIPSAFAWHKGAEGKAAAIVAERAACEISKAEGIAASSKALAEILATIEDDDGNQTAAEACKRDRFCKGGKK